MDNSASYLLSKREQTTEEVRKMAASAQNDPLRSDLELVGLSRQGDVSAFAELISRYYSHCAKVATSVLRNRTTSLDEVQKACWKAFLHLDQYRAVSDFSVWLSGIVINECRMTLRTNRRARFVYIDELGTQERAVLAPG